LKTKIEKMGHMLQMGEKFLKSKVEKLGEAESRSPDRAVQGEMKY